MFRAVLLMCGGALFVGAGCSESEADACSDNQVYEDGACVPKPAGTAGSSTGEAGMPATGEAGMPATGEGGTPPTGEGGAPATGTAGAPSGTGDFGDTCEEHTDCGDPTDYCAKSPVAPAYCTASGCDVDASICPDGWSCFDVSQFSPGEPWICMQPL